MIAIPTRRGWLVEYETEKEIKGRKIWKEDIYTQSKEEAEAKAKELKNKGFTVRMLECIF